MADTLSNLYRVLPPPQSPEENHGDWVAAEAELGTRLPPDYKMFIEAYGTGAIATNPGYDFVWIFNPFSQNWSKNLTHMSKEWFAYFSAEDRSQWLIKYEVFPTPDGLLIWGQCLDGSSLYWRRTGEPHEWTVVVFDSSELSLVEFPNHTFLSFVQELVQERLEGFHIGKGKGRFLTVDQESIRLLNI